MSLLGMLARDCSQLNVHIGPWWSRLAWPGQDFTIDADMEEIEQLAERFLEDIPSYVWDGRTPPVPVEDIADTHVGLLVRDVEDLSAAPGAPRLTGGQVLSGLFLPMLGEIWVNAAEAREWPGRRRFTIAHELGHWRLHRDAVEAVFCRSGSVEPAPPSERPPLPPSEEEANAFAAALLMPARLLQDEYVRCERDFAMLCARFGASGAAMGRRLHAVIKPGTAT
jgi:hypothetical protein